MLALILVVAAGACLAAGWLLDQIVLSYVALGLVAAGLPLVGAALWRRRSTPPPNADPDESARPHDDADSAAADEPGSTVGTQPSDEAREATAEQADALRLADRSTGDRMTEETEVFVITGRKRFHVRSCRMLTGKDTQALTLVEAQDEAFTPCTLCVRVAAPALTEQH